MAKSKNKASRLANDLSQINSGYGQVSRSLSHTDLVSQLQGGSTERTPTIRAFERYEASSIAEMSHSTAFSLEGLLNQAQRLRLVQKVNGQIY